MLVYNSFDEALNSLDKSMKVANKNSVELMVDEFIKDANYYAPQYQNILRLSALIASVPKKGLAIWNTAYAQRLFYGTDFNFSKTANPNAQAKWAEKAAKENINKYKKLHTKILNEQLRKPF